MTYGGDTHIGRSFVGHPLEDGCPCPKEPCGLVARSRAVSECREHPVVRGKSIRQGHSPGDCPGEMPAGERLVQALRRAGMSLDDVAAMADEWRIGHRDEVLREAAERIRDHGGTRGDEFFAEALQAAADLIDPDKEN